LGFLSDGFENRMSILCHFMTFFQNDFIEEIMGAFSGIPENRALAASVGKVAVSNRHLHNAGTGLRYAPLLRHRRFPLHSLRASRD
ncbi:MAG TPA: hypothetical protein PKK43_05860, partial [Spirochaetota bacterium]|nr:hypothetical protein [Spirochaetota bacterium]